MHLDRTRIAIRERGALETLDLALHVLREFIVPLTITMVIGALPLAMLNEIVIGWMVYYDPELPLTAEVFGNGFRYIWTMALLVTVEAPLASVFTTTYLGHAVFTDRPRFRTVWRDVIRVLPRIAMVQLLMRGVLPALLLAVVIDRHVSVSGSDVLLAFFVLFVCLFRSVRPFINEIILLERAPMHAKDPNVLTVQRRSSLLHVPSSTDLKYRYLIAAVSAGLLATALFGAMLTLQGVLFDHWTPGTLSIRLAWPLALWITAGFFTVVRFLNYLNVRIRQEGWEVELRMRAEVVRLAQSGLR